MCSSLLDKLSEVRTECRLNRWTMRNGVEFTVLLNLFSSGEFTVKRIIEALNLLSLIDPSRAAQCKATAKEIVALQGGVQNGPGESIYLMDLQRSLSKILSKDAANMLQKAIDHAVEHFGITATRIRYSPVLLADIDGSFNEPDFSSSLLINPAPTIETVSPVASTPQIIGPPRASSSAEQGGSMEDDWQKLDSGTDFFRKLKNVTK